MKNHNPKDRLKDKSAKPLIGETGKTMGHSIRIWTRTGKGCSPQTVGRKKKKNWPSNLLTSESIPALGPGKKDSFPQSCGI